MVLFQGWRDRCGIEKDRIIICPGNHDIDRDNAIRNAASLSASN